MPFEYNDVPNTKVVGTNLALTLALNVATNRGGPLKLIDDHISYQFPKGV